LIYEELCLRREAGEEVGLAEVVGRFPRWRDRLEVLLDFDRLLLPADPPFPEAGDSLGEFRLLAELGRGAHGRGFLASQPALAGRPVALKVPPREEREPLALARLQHAHIVPLYLVQDFPERGL